MFLCRRNNLFFKEFLLSDSMSLSQLEQAVYRKCKECNKTRRIFDVEYQICFLCYNLKIILKPEQSGNKVIDNFIRYTQINKAITKGKMEFVPYDQFKNIEFIAEGGFSKVYKATWVNGPINNWGEVNQNSWKITRDRNLTVVLKKLNNSKNITSKELNELQIFYQIYSDKKIGHGNIAEYFGITQDPITKDIMIIMTYYSEARGLYDIHKLDIIHRDLHSGNIFFRKGSDGEISFLGDLGISKSATESTNDNENYGIIPYMAPEILQGQKYTKASDIYSFGMIMWESMTGRRPFWDQNHDIELIIDIYDGLRPQIVTNAPDGYIELMKECWHSDPNKRPTAKDVYYKINKIYDEEKARTNNNPTKIIKSSDIGPVTTNHSGAIYKSRLISGMINSAMSIRSSRSVSETDKRKFANLINDDNDQSIKTKKLRENEFNDYLTNEIELDINVDYNKLHEPQNKGYVTKELEFDI
ncbi:kinase-like domain-containing protein [Rhizophagus clarus]|uniref:Kinase-like domain-containing protein n=1 Tax=Rhizophagus clarus TaxID=94130 RepID=A0A8H3M1W3_9GLOM|nr:kinase-like domain-containing protein [Rhizophagus clarus]